MQTNSNVYEKFFTVNLNINNAMAAQKLHRQTIFLNFFYKNKRFSLILLQLLITFPRQLAEIFLADVE